MTEPRVSEVFYRAADHIEAFGHWKGEGFGPGPLATAPACVICAIDSVAHNASGAHRWSDLTAPLYEYLGRGVSIVNWNDHPDRTAAEVIATLRACAVIEAARESERETGDVRAGVRV